MYKQKEKIIHFDILGQELEENCYVAAVHHRAMFVCKVLKVHSKMIRVSTINTSIKDSWLTYPKDTVKLSTEDAMTFILKFS
jgi:hypothetical protein